MKNLDETKRYDSKKVNKNANKRNTNQRGKNKKDIKTKKGKDKKKHTKLKKFLIIFFMLCIILGLIAAGVIAGVFFGFFGEDLKLTKEQLVSAYENSVVYDADGTEIAILSGDEKRKSVSMSEMSEFIPLAYVSIEDERFYTHSGVDIKRTGAATLNYITHFGKSSFGGSTITQQLIKNITNEDEKDWTRKVKEMARAIQVEHLRSKDQILELYLNVIFIGGNDIHGVALASEYYFDKNVKDLSLAESAFLAGINHSPNGYKPFKEDPEGKMAAKIKKRTNTVLAKMHELGKVSKEQYDEAVSQVEAGLAFKQGKLNPGTVYSYHTEALITQIIDQLVEEKDMTESYAKTYLYGGGLKIYSTQKSSIQSTLEEEYKKDKYIVKSKKTKDSDGNYKHSQSAMVIIEQSTGNVVGLVGGLGEKTMNGGWNRATRSTKATGSAMKPLAVIAPAVEAEIITAGTVYDDTPTLFENGTYDPKNYYNGFKGLSTIRDAIEVSQNIIPIKVMAELGLKNSIEFLENIGITSMKNEKLPLAIGGMTNGVTALEMAGGYAAIANDGMYISPTFYTEIKDLTGEIILKPNQEKKRVLTKENAYIVKNILTQPVVGSAGTAKYCAIPGMEVAAKTGTTNDDFDRWLCGFTPYYTAATWYGYDENEEVRYGDGNPAGRIWDAVMTSIHKNLENKSFERPEGIVEATICKDTGELASSNCSKVYKEIFTASTVPTLNCDGHRVQTICNESGLVVNSSCTNVSKKYYSEYPEKEKDATLWESNHQGKFNFIDGDCTINHTKQEEPKEETPTTNTNTTEAPTTNTNTSSTNTSTNTSSTNTSTNTNTGSSSTNTNTGSTSTNTNTGSTNTNTNTNT